MNIENTNKEHPLIFSEKSAHDIDSGRKTQTRRVVTPRNSRFDGGPWPKGIKREDMDWESAWLDDGPSPAGNIGPYLHVPHRKAGTTHRIYPRYTVGDKIWGKEPWQFVRRIEPDYDTVFDNYRELSWYPSDGVIEPGFQIIYRAEPYQKKYYSGKWRPPLFMPRYASRLLLEITEVRGQKLQDISIDDCHSEGCALPEIPRDPTIEITWSVRDVFANLWDTINQARGFGFKQNPWVWCMTLKVTNGT